MDDSCKAEQWLPCSLIKSFNAGHRDVRPQLFTGIQVEPTSLRLAEAAACQSSTPSAEGLPHSGASPAATLLHTAAAPEPCDVGLDIPTGTGAI